MRFDSGAQRNAPGAGYWAGPVAPAVARDMARKYETLLALIRVGDRARRNRALRIAAGRWPGGLRECQCVHPSRYAARLRAARCGAMAPVARRGDWRSRGFGAVVLWADLHALLADQLAWRARGGALRADRSSTPRRGVLVDFIEALHGRARLRWPEPERLEELAGARLRPAHAYAWLATRAGLTTAELDAELFGPDGYIARRPED